MAWSDAAREAATAARQKGATMHKGKISGQLRSGRMVMMKFAVRALDHYGAGDLAKGLATARFKQELNYPVIQYGRQTFKMSSAGRRAVRGAGPEES
jgi:hypothetical protein